MATAFDAALRPLDITSAQVGVLVHLDRRPAATVTDLARLASVTPQTMRRLVVGLERRQLVERRSLDDEGTAVAVVLTDHGFSVLRQAEAVLQEEQEAVLDHFDPAELDRLYDLLDRFGQVYAWRHLSP